MFEIFVNNKDIVKYVDMMWLDIFVNNKVACFKNVDYNIQHMCTYPDVREP